MIVKTPGGRWRVKVKSGRNDVASRTFDRKADAEAWEANQKRAMRLGEWINPALGKESLGSVADRWMSSRRNSVASKTLNVEGHSLRAHLPPRLRNKPINTVRPADFDTLYSDLLGTLARSTVMRFRNTLSSLFGWAVREGLIPANVVLESKVPRGRGQDAKEEIHPFTLEGLQAAYEAMSADHPDQADVMAVLGGTGLRWGELVALRVRDVQVVPYPSFRVSRSAPDGQPIRTITKGGHARTVPLRDDVYELVKARMVGRKLDDLLFVTPRGQRLNGPNWRRAVEWKKYSLGRRPHDLRHTAATVWLALGIDTKTVQSWLGHASMTITVDRYAHFMGTDADAAGLAKLNASVSGGAGGARGGKLRATK
ncbi:tyrosine-type recombinase/integrase [Herbiconiux sp. P18]|uniref:tyrosine-type recombinase/integrase n=1 Tax=Herbiconiux liangxiaofengii TaxID=3342795 RepID=UPI0035B96766